MNPVNDVAKSGPEPTAASRRRHLVAGCGLVGIVLAITGTFLPWLRSGDIPKNSYQIAGAVERYVPSNYEAIANAFAAWPWQGPVWALITILFLLGLRRVAGTLGFLLAVLLGGIAITYLVLGSQTAQSWVTPMISGPLVTVIGACLVIIASPFITLRRRIS